MVMKIRPHFGVARCYSCNIYSIMNSPFATFNDSASLNIHPYSLVHPEYLVFQLQFLPSCYNTVSSEKNRT